MTQYSNEKLVDKGALTFYNPKILDRDQPNYVKNCEPPARNRDIDHMHSCKLVNAQSEPLFLLQ